MKRIKTIMSFIIIISSLFIFSGCSLIGSKVVYVRDGNDKIASRLDYGWILYNKKIKIDEDCTIIGEKAFYNHISIEEIYIPSSVNSIGDSAFEACSGLTSVIIPDSVTSIGSLAFSDCIRLTNITIGNNITSIGDSAFSNCSSLTNVYYTGTIENWYNITFKNSTSNPVYYASHFYVKNSNGIYVELSKDEIPDNKLEDETKKNDGVIYNINGNKKIAIGPENTNATRIVIDDDCTEIDQYAFSKCNNLISVTIGKNVTSIGEYAFSGCRNLTSITIPNSITSIGDSAFFGCYKLVEVYNLSSLNIEKDSFSNGWVGCYAKDIYTALDEPSKLKASNGVVYYINEKEKIAVVPENMNATNIILDNDCTEINQYAFYNCGSLMSVTIGNRVTSIGEFAFHGCSGLTSITIPNSVTIIESFAFDGCISLTCVSIGNSVKSIGYYAFCGCSSLISITIPNSITIIESSAFDGCSSLEKVYYKGTSTDWNKISINSFNPKLTRAKRYYYSATKPSGSGNYWHYDTDGNIKEW